MVMDFHESRGVHRKINSPTRETKNLNFNLFLIISSKLQKRFPYLRKSSTAPATFPERTSSATASMSGAMNRSPFNETDAKQRKQNWEGPCIDWSSLVSWVSVFILQGFIECRTLRGGTAERTKASTVSRAGVLFRGRKCSRAVAGNRMKSSRAATITRARKMQRA